MQDIKKVQDLKSDIDTLKRARDDVRFEESLLSDKEKKGLDTKNTKDNITAYTQQIEAASQRIDQGLEVALQEMVPSMYEEISAKLKKGQTQDERQTVIAEVVADYMMKLGFMEDKDIQMLANVTQDIDTAMQSRKNLEEFPIKSLGDLVRHFVAAITNDDSYLLKNSKTTEEKLGEVVKKSFAERIKEDQAANKGTELTR